MYYTTSIYDTLPPCKAPWDIYESCYEPKFPYDVEFEYLFLFFDYSKSKKYKTALRLYYSIPERYRYELQAHSVQIYHYSDFLIIRKKIEKLIKIVCHWKLSQIWINNELCKEHEYRQFIDIFDRRVIEYKKYHELPEIIQE